LVVIEGVAEAVVAPAVAGKVEAVEILWDVAEA
jgi:hypothetical protein